jgi:hypothetical protein
MRSDGPNLAMAGGVAGSSLTVGLLREKNSGPPGGAVDCISVFGASKPSG